MCHEPRRGLQHSTDGANIDYYNADVATANDYYPFGMLMPGRKYNAPSTSYRYGFNGKEKDKDAGEGIQDYGMRIYDSRLGRFLSVDPLTKSYPQMSPYPFAMNDVIRCIDLDGLEKYYVVNYWKNGRIERTSIEGYKDADTEQMINMQFKYINGGAPLTTQDVLVYDVYDEGTKNENILQSDAKELTKEQLRIFNAAFTLKKLNAGIATVDNELDGEVEGGYTSKKGSILLYGKKKYKYDDDGDGGKDDEKFKIKKLDYDANGGLYGVAATTDVVYMTPEFGKEIKTLATNIKKDGTIKSINVKVFYPYNKNSTEAEITLTKSRAKVAAGLIFDLLKGTGVKINVNTDAVPIESGKQGASVNLGRK